LGSRSPVEGAADAFIGVGSNLGDRGANVRRAAGEIGAGGETVAVSSLYESEPMYVKDQPLFVNCVVWVKTRASPRELFVRLKSLERKMGRRDGARYGPRVIDLDILLYGAEVVREGDLEIPHPRMRERGFVLVPLAEVAPLVVDPVTGKTAGELLDELRSIGGAEGVSKFGT
jgi:2-amino-4-hydroxy-6-hydroxymethyldihydropteridine diphosphokinase